MSMHCTLLSQRAFTCEKNVLYVKYDALSQRFRVYVSKSIVPNISHHLCPSSVPLVEGLHILHYFVSVVCQIGSKFIIIYKLKFSEMSIYTCFVILFILEKLSIYRNVLLYFSNKLKIMYPKSRTAFIVFLTFLLFWIQREIFVWYTHHSENIWFI
jgi:hypothetical protein